ncbi:MAG: hypothetical protein K2W95_35795 [Candidatus Obscuribacterales bacterium]|nr:hypothetical protein [Candidatus Obscuribacterales bacterium]
MASSVNHPAICMLARMDSTVDEPSPATRTLRIRPFAASVEKILFTSARLTSANGGAGT